MIKINGKLKTRSASVDAEGGDTRIESAAVTTTSATVTTVWSWEMPDGAVACLDITVVGRRRGATAGKALYRRSVIVDREAGTVTVGTPDVIGTDVETTSGYDITINASGAAVRVRVTGASGHTIRWVARVALTTVS